jgi:hypothetical protein
VTAATSTSTTTRCSASTTSAPVFKDHEYLARLGKYEHMWGVGRHLLGSQVYDYWCDPWGRVHERWADTDRLNAKSGTNLLPAEEALVSQWGEDPPEKFIRHVTP